MTLQTPETDFPIVFHNNLPVIQMPQRLTVLEAVAFKETCHQLLAKNTLPEQLILDFANTEFIDSSGVGALVHNFKATREKEIELILYHVRPPVMAVLSMTGLDEVLKITATTSDKPKSNDRLPQTHPSVRSWIKRFIDIIGSLVGLAITAILFVPIAIAIKRESPGPIFSLKPAAVGWENGLKLSSFVLCASMRKPVKMKLPIKQKAQSSKTQTIPVLLR